MKLHTPSDVALLVRERRRELRVSQHELARRIGASRQWVQNLEQGRRGLELGLTLRALAALDLSLDARTGAPAAAVAADASGRGLVARDGNSTSESHGTHPPGTRRNPAPAKPGGTSLLVFDLDSIVDSNRSRLAGPAKVAPHTEDARPTAPTPRRRRP